MPNKPGRPKGNTSPIVLRLPEHVLRELGRYGGALGRVTRNQAARGILEDWARAQAAQRFRQWSDGQ